MNDDTRTGVCGDPIIVRLPDRRAGGKFVYFGAVAGGTIA